MQKPSESVSPYETQTALFEPVFHFEWQPDGPRVCLPRFLPLITLCMALVIEQTHANASLIKTCTPSLPPCLSQTLSTPNQLKADLEQNTVLLALVLAEFYLSHVIEIDTFS